MGTKTFINSWTFDETQVLSHSVNSSSIYKLLVAVRKEVEWHHHKENINKLHKSECLKQIVTAFRSSHLHDVSVTLCILENCCMDSTSANNIVVNYKGLCELLQVLKRYPKEDHVNGKVMRIIGNMNQYLIADEILDKELQLFIYIVQFLQNVNVDVNSFIFTMGVRALRMILNGRTFNEMVENFGLLKVLGTLLITTRLNSTKKDQCILKNIMKHLLPYCQYNYYPGIIEIRNTAKADTSVCFGQLLPFAPRKVVKIAINFIRKSQLKLDLPIPVICGGFIRLLRKNPVIKGSNQKYRLYYIRCLCYLLEHPSNRNSDRCMGTVPQLINELNNFKNFTESILESSILILGALYKCCSHKLLAKEQLECNIVGVLIKKIEWIIGNSRTLICKPKMQINRSYPDIVSFYWNSMEISCQDLWDLRLLTLAPSSSLFEKQQEGVTKPCTGISDYGDYSPVCNSFEEPMISENSEKTNMEIARLLHIKNNNSEGSLRDKLMFKILLLLKTYFEIQPTPSQLCSEPLLLILIKCSNYFDRNSMITNIITELICEILQ